MPKAHFLAAAALILVSSSVTAKEVKDAGVVLFEVAEGLTISFEPIEVPKGANGMSILVVGPKEYEAFLPTGKEIPRIRLEEFGDIADGVYSYEVRGTTGEKIALKEEVNNGRDKPSTAEFVTFAVAGEVWVKNGKIISFDPDAVDVTKPTKGEDLPPKDGDEENSGEKPGEDGKD